MTIIFIDKIRQNLILNSILIIDSGEKPRITTLKRGGSMKVLHYTNYFNIHKQLRFDSNNQIQTSKINNTNAIQAMNIDIKYTIHEGTDQLILRIYDSVNNNLIKEIPAEKILDIKAKIHQYVGLLLDKRI